ncbi:type IV secretion system DNA-binding domain-containing protein [Pleurocapsa sp. PCC 7319]|uniref:type IV secretion system DNA-binding domain-containing protein n=1 Tax=Pleurocapsa sp. PCC 7319 TaxID=118161 RepID=UPI00034B59D9|nr:type IV secretion system DNA-binding domain-containing protein [Pleurocapsa sp. PCC 7319]
MKPKNNDNSSLIAMLIFIAVLLLVLWVMNNTEVALFLIEHPVLIWPYLLEKLVDKFGYFKLISSGLIMTFTLTYLLMKPNDKLSHHNQNVVRGAKVIPTRQLKAIQKKEQRPKNQPQLTIAGIPIPAEYEQLGFFMFGSPGTGKTQAISQMAASMRQRSDFRAIIFDRGGEMLEKFYDPTLDIIFNPFDARSIGWSHIYESARPENIAAALIPTESEKEPFFSNAARVIMAELFRQTKSNQELWSLLVSDTQTIHSFISETLAARYTGEEKSAASVLSTVSNYCQFYQYMTEQKNYSQSISFFDWARRDCSGWIFITLEENDSDLLKPLHSLIFELMLKGLLSNRNREIKTAIIIDELGALGRLPSLSRLMSESRKFGGCPILGTQTKSQITKVYGKEDTSTILQGIQTKLILRSVDHETAESMADTIGKQELIDIAQNHSRSRRAGRNGNGRTDGYNEQFRERYAVMPDEIKSLPNLFGYLKLGRYCAPVELKHQSFPPCARRYVPLRSHEQQSIQEQWSDLKE